MRRPRNTALSFIPHFWFEETRRRFTEWRFDMGWDDCWPLTKCPALVSSGAVEASFELQGDGGLGLESCGGLCERDLALLARGVAGNCSSATTFDEALRICRSIWEYCETYNIPRERSQVTSVAR